MLKYLVSVLCYLAEEGLPENKELVVLPGDANVRLGKGEEEEDISLHGKGNDNNESAEAVETISGERIKNTLRTTVTR